MSTHNGPIVDLIREEVPDRPGVYLFHDETSRVLYVGKSVRLRQRMLSYFRSRFETTKLRRMVRAIESFTFLEAETELLALLLEDRLIKEHLPEYNTQQRDYLKFEYIQLSEDPFPICRRAPHDRRGKGRTWGPFKDCHFVDRLLRVVHEQLRLRSCTEAEPTQACLQHELGQCPGPCIGRISRQAYQRIVDDVCDFLDGEGSTAVEALRKKMRNCSHRLEFEAAHELRQTMEFAERFGARQRFFRRFRSARLILVDEVDPRTYVFERGHLRWHSAIGTAIPELPDPSPNPRDGEDTRFVTDRALIAHRWLLRHEGRYELRSDPCSASRSSRK